MIKLNIKITEENKNFINESINRKTLLHRVKKTTGITNINLYKHIEEKCDSSKLVLCNWCNSVKSFKSFEYIIENLELYISDIIYDGDSLICKRKDNDVTKNCKYKSINSNSIEYIMGAHNMTDVEAINYIHSRNSSPFYKVNHLSESDYKKSQRRDEEFYGIDKFNEVKRNISNSNSKKSMIDRHGYAKYKEICDSKDTSSVDYFKKKYGDDWEDEYIDKNSKTIQTLENFTKRFGLNGVEKHNEFLNNKSNSMNNYLNSISTETSKLNYDTNSKTFFKRKYGDDWEDEYYEHHKNLQSKCSRSSKESLVFFDMMLKYTSVKDDYFIGDGDRNEYFIYDEKNKNIKFYDFCIPSLKIIIEYHGSLWHYNENYNYKRDLPFGLSIEENKKKDLYKKELATKNGFDYYVVFDTDDFQKKCEIISKIIKYKERCYE